jgi:putative addiction module component (TIGR02574 family)
MTSRAAQLLDEVLKLSEAERAEIAAAVLASLDGPEPSADERAEVEAAWQAEIKRRLEQFKADGHAIPWEQVRAKLRAARSRR